VSIVAASYIVVVVVVVAVIVVYWPLVIAPPLPFDTTVSVTPERKMFLWWMMRIPMMLLGLMAFNTKCTMMAFQPRPQRTARMTTLRFQHSSDDLPVRVAVLETSMNAMTKTLERIESKIDTTLDEIDTKIDRKIAELDKEIDRKIEREIERTDTKIERSESLAKTDIEWKDSQLWFLTNMGLAVLNAIFNSGQLTPQRVTGILNLAILGAWFNMMRLLCK
jgi:hypothetical protein